MIDKIDDEFKVACQGLWFDFGNSKLRIAYAKRPEVIDELQSKSLNGVTDVETLCESLSKHVLIDWDCVVDLEGNYIVYDQSVCKNALMSNSNLLQLVVETSFDRENFKRRVQ